jgi:hypothetical protein
MLCHDHSVFMNGETTQANDADYAQLRELADNRELPPVAGCSADLADLLYQWYQDGYLFPR